MSIKRTGSLDQALNRFITTDKAHVRVGVLEGSKYPDGTNVASVAFWNEYGTRTAPPRPFFRDTIKNEKQNWSALATKAIRMGYTVEHMLGLVGSAMQTDIQHSIMTWSSPRNSPTTIAIKGYDAPLRNTMLLHDSIKFEISEESL